MVRYLRILRESPAGMIWIRVHGKSHSPSRLCSVLEGDCGF